jgi:hypothetical protein
MCLTRKISCSRILGVVLETFVALGEQGRFRIVELNERSACP